MEQHADNASITQGGTKYRAGVSDIVGGGGGDGKCSQTAEVRLRWGGGRWHWRRRYGIERFVGNKVDRFADGAKKKRPVDALSK